MLHFSGIQRLTCGHLPQKITRSSFGKTRSTRSVLVRARKNSGQCASRISHLSNAKETMILTSFVNSPVDVVIFAVTTSNHKCDKKARIAKDVLNYGVTFLVTQKMYLLQNL